MPAFDHEHSASDYDDYDDNHGPIEHSASDYDDRSTDYDDHDAATSDDRAPVVRAAAPRSCVHRLEHKNHVISECCSVGTAR